MSITIRRLGAGDRDDARRMFATMAQVFGEVSETLADAYVDGLLARADFWAIAAYQGGDVVGGITAHTLPMTRRAASEVFIYDLAVRADMQRRGIGRTLVESLRREAIACGIHVMFVAADAEDEHALDFYRAIGGDGAPVTIFTFE